MAVEMVSDVNSKFLDGWTNGAHAMTDRDLGWNSLSSLPEVVFNNLAALEYLYVSLMTILRFEGGWAEVPSDVIFIIQVHGWKIPV